MLVRFQGRVLAEKGGERRAWEKVCAPGREEDEKDEQGEHKTFAPQREEWGQLASRYKCLPPGSRGQTEPGTWHRRVAALCVFAGCLLLLCLDQCWVFKKNKSHLLLETLKWLAGTLGADSEYLH